MNEFKGSLSPEKSRETDRPQVRESDSPRLPSDAETRSTPFADSSAIFKAAFRNLGLIADTSEEKDSDTSESSEKTDCSDYLEKGDDGKYYDKETGKSYDTIEEWTHGQEVKAKRAESTAEFWEKKAKKEYAQYKEAQEKGDTEKAKQHYLNSQYCYNMSQKCKESAAKYREKLGEKKTDQHDETAEQKSETADGDEGSEINKPIQNKIDGLAREKEVSEELAEKYPPEDGYEVVSEAYLRDKNGKLVKDPETGEARRIDFVVVKDGKVVDSVEVTSKTADKTAQTAKEERIRESGGNYVKDNNGNLVEIPTSVQTRIERRD